MVDTISQSEIDNIEKEVNAKLANETKKSNEELARRIREDVEKELKAKQELETLREQQKKMSEELEKAKAETLKTKEEYEKNSNELKAAVTKQIEEALAQKKGITIGNQSPFQSSQPSTPTTRIFPDGKSRDVAQLSPQEVDAVLEESRQKFMDFLGIRDAQARAEWGVDPREKYK